MVEIEFYEARGDIDTTEGRGGTFVIARFKQESDAMKCAAKKGVWGRDGYVRHEKIRIYDNAEEMELVTSKDRAQEILSKLPIKDRACLDNYFTGKDKS